MQDLRVTKYDGRAHAFPADRYEKYSSLNELLLKPEPGTEKKTRGKATPLLVAGKKK